MHVHASPAAQSTTAVASTAFSAAAEGSRVRGAGMGHGQSGDISKSCEASTALRLRCLTELRTMAVAMVAAEVMLMEEEAIAEMV